MDITVTPGLLKGQLDAIASKSLLHRYLICAAFADAPTMIHCNSSGDDVAATISCLQALGAQITQSKTGFTVSPVQFLPNQAMLDCGQSGTTLRLLLPIIGVLGITTTFRMSGRLPNRPLSPLWEEMERMGCALSYGGANTLICSGQLRSGQYHINGQVSSQFISGLLLALTMMPGESALVVTGKTESGPYIDLTKQVLAEFSVNADTCCTSNYRVFCSPGEVLVEGDWSNSAFFLAANELGNNIALNGLRDQSCQGDRLIKKYLPLLKHNCTLNVSDVPDLVPILSIISAANCGAVFTGISRLRFKESDRVYTISSMLEALGASVNTTDNTMTVFPAKFRGCTIHSHGDHRIAMAAAIAATIADGPVTILDAQCVNKSYPSFWEDYRNLGGTYEQYIR